MTAQGRGDADGTSDDSGEERYVHRPADDDGSSNKPRGEERTFGVRGWILVVWLIIALVIVPAVLFYIPQAGTFTKSLGLGYRDAFLILPLLPALILGILAVWATTRP